MLQIVVPSIELFDEETETFSMSDKTVLKLEHSLVSISKWESVWHKPFLTKDEKTTEESRDYVRCMTINRNVSPEVYLALTPENYSDINSYIETDQTATWFNNTNTTPSREIFTSELIYYFMVSYNIPWEAQKWHLSRLLTLIRICQLKNEPPKKMAKNKILARNKALNAARRAKLGSKG